MRLPFPVQSANLIFATFLLVGNGAWAQVGQPALQQDPEPTPTRAVKPSAVAATPTGESRLPPGLFDPDPMVRITAVEQVAAEGLIGAKGKLISLARSDEFANVRAAACRALGTLQAQDQLELLRHMASRDPNAEVRAAAAAAVRQLTGEPQPTPAGPIFPQEPAPAQPTTQEQDSKYKLPEYSDEPIVDTRIFGFGFGSMGGYGVAALSARFRLATSSEFLPWIAIELGAGWTPPHVYQVIAGPVGEVTNEDHYWTIISAAGGLNFYLHRLHYVALRGGFDLGQGPYVLLGYGLEMLNDEGFFSWGVEAGLLYHPVIDLYVDNFVDCSSKAACTDDDLWPIVPFIRFSLHFYLI